jgi:hypothetical protein
MQPQSIAMTHGCGFRLISRRLHTALVFSMAIGQMGKWAIGQLGNWAIGAIVVIVFLLSIKTGVNVLYHTKLFQ